MARKQAGLIRTGVYTVEHIFKLLHLGTDYIIVGGDKIKAKSMRYQLFMKKGCACVKCGMVGYYFAKERHHDNVAFHLNLYGIHNGHETLMTKDHIIPKARGGADTMQNLQPMCSPCNAKKGSGIAQVKVVIGHDGITHSPGAFVQKRSGKKFKSNQYVNTVREITINPNTDLPAYSFLEDDSVVDVKTCIGYEGQLIKEIKEKERMKYGS